MPVDNSIRIVFQGGDVLLTRGRVLQTFPNELIVLTANKIRWFFDVDRVWQGRGEL